MTRPYDARTLLEAMRRLRRSGRRLRQLRNMDGIFGATIFGIIWSADALEKDACQILESMMPKKKARKE